MKPFIMSIATLLVAVPAAAAGEILPNLYAREYCELREIGVAEDEAMAAAVEEAYIDNGKESVKVTVDGKEYGADVVRAYRAVERRCPEYL
jgi:hypothetical protein